MITPGSVNPLLAAGGEYEISRSLRFNSADSAYLNRTPASAGNRKTWTWSGWVKRSALSDGMLFTTNNAVNPRFSMSFTSDQIRVFDYNGSTYDMESATTPIYRDVSAWYHVVVALDTTQATITNRLKIYVNGSQVTAFAYITYPAQNFEPQINRAIAHYIGTNNSATYLNAYLTEVNFIDGQALTPSSFGETDPITGVWRPKKYTGTYGTNGFYLPFSDNTSTTTLGYDESGNNNDWTLNNFSVTAGAGNDSLVDVPTRWGSDTGAGGEVRGNYATLNPLQQTSTASITDGNLRLAAGATAWGVSLGTIGISSGKWYWEVTTLNDIHPQIGIGTSETLLTDYVGRTAASYAYRADDGYKVTNATATAYGASFTTNDIIGVALDMDAGTIVFYKNGVSQGTAFTGLSGTFFPAVSTYNSKVLVVNFGQRPWAYTPPTGYKALCTTNLPDPVIKQGDDYFNAVLYTGNGSTNAITGVGFQPDFVWAKGRSVAYSHGLFDAIRGATKKLSSNLADAEVTQSGLTAFGSDGFTMGSDAGTNQSSATYVAWNWKAGGTGVTNTAGTITSTVSANTTAGFSIVTYTGTGANATVGHGLGVAPKMIIVKRRDSSTNGDWFVYTATTGNGNALFLNLTNATAATGGAWNNTSPTSTVFTVGTSSGVNASGSTYVAYCFSEVAGYSKFGSYTGNGSTNGPMIFTGFRPRFVMIKRTDVADNWHIQDTSTSPTNEAQNFLLPNSSIAESTAAGIDVLSNGFKLRTSGNGRNANGGTYIYAAFAEHPLKFSLAR